MGWTSAFRKGGRYLRLMVSITVLSLITVAFVQNTIAAPSVTATGDQAANPRFRRAAYGHESIALDNGLIRLVMFKRLNGWGWGELYTPSGQFMAVLEHLGEVMIRDQDIPVRLEADSIYTASDAEGTHLTFTVKSTVVRDKLKGTSFEKWMLYPLEKPCVVGDVTLTMPADKPVVYMRYRLTGTANYCVRYIRGPWLKVGEDSFGIAKDDAIFPGVEWLVGDEWSSGSDWFKYPWSERFVPHPNKVAIPLMALSYQGVGVGLSWEPNQTATRWFNFRTQRPQPVFASPNSIDRMNNTLMGLMVPDASVEGQENKPYADIPLELRVGQMIEFDAELWLSKGNSLDVVTDYVRRHGLPEPPAPRWPFRETLDRIAGAYNNNFWVEGKGFNGGTAVPAFLDRYIRETAKSKLAADLKKKIEWCRAHQPKDPGDPGNAKLIEQADALLKLQREDGSYYFDPEGRHYVKDDFKVATSFIEPMGHAGDAALDLCMTPVPVLLDAAAKTGREDYKAAAKKALDYCMTMTRPEGGDYWETPLHAPNLYAAGHAAVAYYLGFKVFGDERYKNRAVYWIRALLPFTHLWETAEVPMMYNTKPCLCSSDWYFANWVRDHVQWEVLSTFVISTEYGIDWSVVDPDIDWTRYFTGVTVAVTRWMHTGADNDWRPHNLPETYESFRSGQFDYYFADTHNSTTGNYGGAFIGPEMVAQNIYTLIDRGVGK